MFVAPRARIPHELQPHQHAQHHHTCHTTCVRLPVRPVNTPVAVESGVVWRAPRPLFVHQPWSQRTGTGTGMIPHPYHAYHTPPPHRRPTNARTIHFILFPTCLLARWHCVSAGAPPTAPPHPFCRTILSLEKRRLWEGIPHAHAHTLHPLHAATRATYPCDCKLALLVRAARRVARVARVGGRREPRPEAALPDAAGGSCFRGPRLVEVLLRCWIQHKNKSTTRRHRLAATAWHTRGVVCVWRLSFVLGNDFLAANLRGLRRLRQPRIAAAPTAATNLPSRLRACHRTSHWHDGCRCSSAVPPSFPQLCCQLGFCAFAALRGGPSPLQMGIWATTAAAAAPASPPQLSQPNP